MHVSLTDMALTPYEIRQKFGEYEAEIAITRTKEERDEIEAKIRVLQENCPHQHKHDSPEKEGLVGHYCRDCGKTWSTPR